MANVNDIKWGSYKQWEGPYYLGKCSYSLPQNPTHNDKTLAVITTTEGGRFDAINMYDSCVLSSGLIQWCEAHYFVSNMLGIVADKDYSLLSPLDLALKASQASFRKRKDGKWRFFFNDGRGEVNTLAKQQSLFLACSGEKGLWNDASKQHALFWASCVASVWENKAAQLIQVEHTASRLNIFYTKASKEILFGSSSPQDNNGINGALRSAYCSFAANLPAVASKNLCMAVSQTKATPWSKVWAIDILRQLTFGPKIMIYPGRYDKIRPVLEKLYGVDLPDFAQDLAVWNTQMGISETSKHLLDIKEIQKELILRGYDLGPKGADGTYGPKTRQAVKNFQTACGLVSDGIPGEKTQKAFAISLRSKCLLQTPPHDS
jgi:hypothetical protein